MTDSNINKVSEKSATTALLLCLFLGGLGIHRFYVGKIGTGILMILTVGGLGIWTLIDLIMIACGEFKDKNGYTLEFKKSSGSTAKKVILILLLLLLAFSMFIGVIVSIAMYATSGITGAVRDQLVAIRAGDFNKAYSYTSTDFRQSTSLNNFQKYVEQYPALINNADSTFNQRSIENNVGTIKGYVTGKNGATTNVEYRLIKEDGEWKILNMKVNPGGAGIAPGAETQKVSSSSSEKSAASDSKEVSLPNLYESKENQYTIHYPENWEYTKPDKATVVFGGKEGSEDYNSTVNIQTVLTKADGGKYETSEQLMDSLKNQAKDQYRESEILTEGPVTIDATNDSEGMKGLYIVFTYVYQGEKFKQMQFVFEREDGQAFYAWAYTSTAGRYEADYMIAKAMFDSWAVH